MARVRVFVVHFEGVETREAPKRWTASCSPPSRSTTRCAVGAPAGRVVRVEVAGNPLGLITALVAKPAERSARDRERRARPGPVRRVAAKRGGSSSIRRRGFSSDHERLTMRIDVFTIFPALVDGFSAESLLGRARDRRAARPARARPARRTPPTCTARVDDAPFGGGAGMVLRPEPLFAAVEAVEPPRPLLLLGPGGRRFDQALARELAAGRRLLACCAGATRASTTGCATTSSTASCRSATSCSAGGEVAALRRDRGRHPARARA